MEMIEDDEEEYVDLDEEENEKNEDEFSDSDDNEDIAADIIHNLTYINREIIFRTRNGDAVERIFFETLVPEKTVSEEEKEKKTLEKQQLEAQKVSSIKSKISTTNSQQSASESISSKAKPTRREKILWTYKNKHYNEDSRYLSDALPHSRTSWKPRNKGIYYAGPLPFLLLLHLHSTDCENQYVNRKIRPICYWNYEKIKSRQNIEKAQGQLGLVTLVEDIDLIQQKDEEDVDFFKEKEKENKLKKMQIQKKMMTLVQRTIVF
ncbi:unnamed protein product [Lactuca virosa]|uniref:Uncharacterized protein n=1 Tax=Lactuca virosa TaxID=75947 RepID=A0AAU9PLJ6_9ASTR|nr:unnamed protein product [Lactuca virosa]